MSYYIAWSGKAPHRRAYVYIPYFSHAAKFSGARWKIAFNGGEIVINPALSQTIMFYGASGNLPLELLDDLLKSGTTLVIHHRGSLKATYLTQTPQRMFPDTLSSQLSARSHFRKRLYIAKTLVDAKISSQKHLLTLEFKPGIKMAPSLESLRVIEAHAASRYWSGFYHRIGFPDLSRRTDHPINKALDAASFFMVGLILRWVVLHKLSPIHGYLHETTGYPSLIYDLIEPYRIYSETAVENALSKTPEDITRATISELNDLLNVVVYVPSTRQYVKRKNLLHGVVLALKAYLLGNSQKFVIPVEGLKNGGRPHVNTFRIPGGIIK